MTSPVSASENTSPALSVRSSEDLRDLKNDPPPLPALSKAITPTWSVPSGKAITSTLALTLDGPVQYQEEKAQLSERESIFATHYLTSDSTANTPHLPSTVEGRDDDLNTQQDAAAKMGVPVPHPPHPPEPPLFFHKARSSSAVASIRGFEKSVDARTGRYTGLPPTQPRSFGGSDYRRTRATSLERIDREKQVHVISPFTRSFETPVNRSSPPRKRTVTPSMSGAGERTKAENYRKGERPHWREQSKSTGEERSSSLNEKGYVEKRIEATLANAEPAQNARSRKTSHYLGLFKENTPSQDQKRREEKCKAKTSKGKGSQPEDQARVSDEDRRPADRDFQGSTREGGKLDSDASRGARLGRLLQPPAALQYTPDHENGMQRQTLQVVFAGSAGSNHLVDASNNTPGGDNRSAHTSNLGNEGTVCVPGDDLAHAFPLRLLEEIRNHHNLTPGADRGTSFSRSIPTITSERNRSSSSKVLSQPAPDHGSKTSRDHDEGLQIRGSGDNEDEDESDKEQISSALYFPHQTPSLETIERVKPSEKTKIEDTHHYDSIPGSDVRLLEHSRSEHQESQSNEVDIDLQSSDEHRYLHGDLQQPLLPFHEGDDQPYAKLSEVGHSPASNSDYESLDETYSSREDELNLTDDADTTPTATPITHTPLTRLKPRNARPPAPLGAVELKPYNHQVGGHTTVFRFSRRAVCKQLSNRENEFYETIERRHPELLRFLPRYIGVLNVTYRKAPKRKKVGKDAETKQGLRNDAGSASTTQANLTNLAEPGDDEQNQPAEPPSIAQVDGQPRTHSPACIKLQNLRNAR
ncbi:MAG: hypothetical protein M1830_002110 [Pleopsidium flavum]|nr:MAG: hypothetical protein M1830_002110 [Pleopsidium flavum]